jgi:hypothetical protein
MTHSDTISSTPMNITEQTVETETREARFVKWWKENIQHTQSQATHFTTHSSKKVKKLIDSSL